MGALSFLQSVLNGVQNSSREQGESLLAGAKDAFLLPRDAYRGDVQTQPTMMTEADGLRVANMAGNIGTGGFAMTKPEGALGMFAGRTAKTADQGALLAADIGEGRGHTPKAIQDATGWFRGPVDDKWKFEISDHAAEPTGARAPLGGNLTVGEVLKHDDLFAAYPQLKNLPVNNTGEFGHAAMAARRTGPPLYINARHDDPQFTSLMLHELQHAVQRYEGFGGGANPAMAEIASAKPVIDAYAISPEAGRHAGWNAYSRAAGEVESRAVQDRMFMTPQARRNYPMTEYMKSPREYPIPPERQWLPGRERPFIDEAYK